MKLYIVHGWTYDIAPFEKMAATLKKQGISVELLHVPGLTAPSKKAWTIQQYADWAEENIPDGAVALGHSNGGRILMNMLVEHPKKLKGLILFNSAGVYEKPTFKRRVFRVAAKILAPLKGIKPLRRFVHKFIGAHDYGKAPENMKKTLENMISSDKNLDPSKITVPTALLWGAKDNMTPLAQGKQLHKLIRGSKLTIEPDWPHSPYLKDPEGTAKVIAKVYKELVK